MLTANARASLSRELMGGCQSRYRASSGSTCSCASAFQAAASVAAFCRRVLLPRREAALFAALATALRFASRVRGSGDGSSGAGTGGRAGGGGASSTTPPTNQVSKSSNSAVQSSSTWNSSLFPTATQTQNATGSGC